MGGLGFRVLGGVEVQGIGGLRAIGLPIAPK